MRLAKRMDQLGTESAFEVLARAKRLEAQGQSVVHLEIGEPDFATPPHIIAAAEAAVTRLTAEIARIDATLAEAGLFARDPEKAAALAKARADHVNALAAAEEDWLTASAELEADR